MQNLIYLFIVFFSISSFCQDKIQVDDQRFQINFPSGFDQEEKFHIDTFSGSIYSQDNFVKGQIVDKLSQRTKTIMLRYDAYHDIFETNSTPSDDDYKYVRPDETMTIVVNDTPFIYSTFVNQEGHFKKGYLQELLKLGDATLYYRFEKTVLFPEKARDSYTLDAKGKIKNNYYYVIKQPNKQATPINITHKNIAFIFPQDLQSRVAEITKTKKLKFKEPEDIISLVKSVQ